MPAAVSRRAVPVVVGVGDIKNPSPRVEDAREPMDLMLHAARAAIQDTGLSARTGAELQSQIDSVSVVNTWTWQYAHLPDLLSEKLGVRPRHTTLSHHGGDSPAKQLDEAARRISVRASKVALLTGGEALASLRACAAAGKSPPGWTAPVKGGNAQSQSMSQSESLSQLQSLSVGDMARMGESESCAAARRPGPGPGFGSGPGSVTASVPAPGPASARLELTCTGIGTRHSVGLPIHVYPLYENGLRAHRGQSVPANNQESAELYAGFAQVAARNPRAWHYGQPAAPESVIGTVSRKNRMICFPYPLLMNAFNNVNLAASCILTSTEYATELGIPEGRWIYPLGGAGSSDAANFWERPNFHSSPALSRSLDAALRVSALTKDEIDVFDFYSCFPIVPKLACRHLGLPLTKQSKPVTLLGGLTSFGGAGNNYSMHALTEMVRVLRKGEGKRGLVLANGGMLTYQYAVCLSSQPRTSPYPDRNPLPERLDDEPVPAIATTPEGEAVIETYTVEFGRDGRPVRGHIVGRLVDNGHRFLANHGDEKTLQQLSSASVEPIGRRGWVKAGDGGRNSFTFDRAEKL